MKKKRKLTLSKETLRNLSAQASEGVVGGSINCDLSSYGTCSNGGTCQADCYFTYGYTCSCPSMWDTCAQTDCYNASCPGLTC
jgi:hypothetical protein